MSHGQLVIEYVLFGLDIMSFTVLIHVKVGDER